MKNKEILIYVGQNFGLFIHFLVLHVFFFNLYFFLHILMLHISQVVYISTTQCHAPDCERAEEFAAYSNTRPRICKHDAAGRGWQ